MLENLQNRSKPHSRKQLNKTKVIGNYTLRLKHVSYITTHCVIGRGRIEFPTYFRITFSISDTADRSTQFLPYIRAKNWAKLGKNPSSFFTYIESNDEGSDRNPLRR